MNMKFLREMKWLAFSACLIAPAMAQQQAEDDVPLMRPDERKTVDEQSDAFNKALKPILTDAAKSTVVVWGKDRRVKALCYGTVVGDGTKILSKWSEIERYAGLLYVIAGNGVEARVEVAGVYTDEDLVLLQVVDGQAATNKLIPAKFFPEKLSLGRFITAPQPSGKLIAFGVVGVLERNLRETDQAHLGIMADIEYRGDGVKIGNVQPEYGAADAGLRGGDIILKVDNRAISGLQELKNAMSSKHPGDTVTIRVDSAGKERDVIVTLSNRPVMGQFSGDRLNQMEVMGGRVSRVRSGFSRIIQSDLRIKYDKIGGPVVDLQGRVVGITMARADRTRTYIMGSEAVLDLLKSKSDTVDEALAKGEATKLQLAKQQNEMMPRMNPQQGKPRDVGRMRRHLSDMERLMGRMREEMEALETP